MVSLEKASTETHLAGGFAHEMRNALHPASITLDSLLDSPDLNLAQAITEVAGLASDLAGASAASQQRLAHVREVLQGAHEAMGTANHAVARALRITEQILTFASVGSLHPGDEHVLATRLLHRLGTEFAERLQAQGVDWQLEVPTDLHLAVKEDYAHTVLRNLIANACDALGDSRTPRSIRIRASRGQGAVRIAVQDTGLGMRPEVHGRLFEPFFSTKGARGTGLGLGLSRRLMRLYGGSIEVESAVDAGTTVTLSWPDPHSG